MIPTTLNGQRYTVLLEDYIFPFSCFVHDNEFILMLGNSSIYTAEVVKEWIMERETTILSGPDKSTDLNPIENILRTMVRMVYSTGK